MKGKVAFVAGAGLGYLLGTRAGRGQFDKIQTWAGDVWKDPRIQGYVQDLEVQARAVRPGPERGAQGPRRRRGVGGDGVGRTKAPAPDPDEIVIEDDLDPNARRF